MAALTDHIDDNTPQKLALFWREVGQYVTAGLLE